MNNPLNNIVNIVELGENPKEYDEIEGLYIGLLKYFYS